MFTFIATTIKTPSSKWFYDVNPEAQHQYFDWVNTFPGVISVTHKRVDENTFIRTMQFTNREAYERFKVARESQPGFVARMEHIKAENQIVGIQEIED